MSTAMLLATSTSYMEWGSPLAQTVESWFFTPKGPGFEPTCTCICTRGHAFLLFYYTFDT